MTLPLSPTATPEVVMIQNPAAALALAPRPRVCSAGIALALRLLGLLLLLGSLLAVDSVPLRLWPLLLLPAGAGAWLCLVSLYLRGHRLSDVMDLGPIRWYQ